MNKNILVKERDWRKELDRKLKPFGAVVQICPVCEKVDVSRGHGKVCNPQAESDRQENLEYYD